jgi:hypothetical protein
MGIIEQIIEMQSQGIQDNQIVATLQEQGISPREINDALNQAQIKQAVSSETQDNYSQAPSPNTQELTENYAPQPEQEMQQDYYQDTQGYSSEGDTETMVEIAEQVCLEKIQSLQKKIDSLSEFKSLAEVKITNLEERLSRIEKIIDKLQISILEKVGSYGKNLENTKKEMDMMQDSFRKVIGKKRNFKK